MSQVWLQAGKQSCQIFLGTTNQNGKNIPNGHKMAKKTYTNWTLNIPIGPKIYQLDQCKIYQMAIIK
jgi:hypothetical protein